MYVLVRACRQAGYRLWVEIYLPHICRTPPNKRILTKPGAVGGIVSIINRAKFQVSRLRGLNFKRESKTACSRRKAEPSLTLHCSTVHASDKFWSSTLGGLEQ